MNTSSHGMTVNDFGLEHAHWRNWVGNQSCVRAARAAPASEDELCALIAGATGKGMNVRVAGSGHSFTPVALTSGLHLTLAKMKGVKHIDHERRRVTASAGTTINELVKVLKAEGLSMINQGDIDSQAIAGALTTGTHGTGAALPVLADAIVGMKLIQPDGSIITVDESTPDLLLAGRVSLGLLGAISEMTLQLTDSYRLRERIWREDFESAMEMHDELAARHRHFSFFWCPYEQSRHCYCLPDTSATSKSGRTTDVCEMKVMDITDEEPFEAEFEKVAYSSDVYPIEYVANFHELEYAVPREHGKDAVRAVRRLMLEEFPDAIYPIEYRFTAGDEAWMSPFHRQDSVTVSVSGEPGKDYWDYLRAVDQILRGYGARPHWGKMHFLTGQDVTDIYPRADDFRALRRKLDPQGFYLNDHLSQLFR
ncbi:MULTISPECIES: D-arabinono-1,4-lactone oxidase [Paracoccus]|jgi:FAD/FMN-containing dehydrogenase|uniref:FAD-linked oxidoreductase n=1 Tax=Paracoccus denitrificans (strain Pd 1222) TaxID=318586 RepID=A1B808_PARDP|nr:MULTISPECIES: D-arabinono-1,4-lactone oxidase [Paracoccus]ABL71652.1 FAD-linked oxidoreductase [Paracoccus denitrificans PD1222]MBB4629798.1 FAD/FMN-containing dehydrogenase [Paracoccus denitrificans]MCU7431234.1 FAD-binding protein [Paracoccus denitrificans]QAR28243.1 FAD-binding protein [Paracoccus denitrificans]UPV97980.1 FAD-binding protein [Paracoccus denitrificans]